MPDELFDIIDENDLVVGREKRSVVHRHGLWHRGVHVLLFTREGKLLLQQRSKDRLQAPLALDCSVSEHVKAGEEYRSAAERGLLEELGVVGIAIDPVIKFKLEYGPSDNEISQLYLGLVNPADVRFDPAEIEGIYYFEMDDLLRGIESKELNSSFWLEQIIRWYTGLPSRLEVLVEYPPQPHLPPTGQTVT